MVFEKGTFLKRYLKDIIPMSAGYFLKLSKDSICYGNIVDLGGKSPFIQPSIQIGKKRKFQKDSNYLFKKQDVYELFGILLDKNFDDRILQKKLNCLFYEVENKRVKMIRHETNAVNDWLESFCDLTKIFSSDDNQKLIDQNLSDQETISF